MAGERVNEYSIGDANLSALMISTDAQRIGYHAVSLTEYDTTSEPEIAAGSKIEVNGALYKFDTDEEITGSPSDGNVYIKLIPSGSSITAEFTNDAPTWDDEKQGWYESGTNNRYLNYGMTLSSGSYENKYSFRNVDTPNGSPLQTKNAYGFMEDGTPLYAKETNNITFSAIADGSSGAHGISNALTNDRIKDVRVRILHGGGTFMYNIEDDNYSGHQYGIQNKYWDDTTLYLTRAGTGAAVTAICLIIYTD